MENQNNIVDKSFKNNQFFYGVLIFIFLHFLLSVNTDMQEYVQHQDINIPLWYFYMVFAVNVLVVLSLILIAFYKKIGVYLFPVFILTHFYMHDYFLSTFLYSDLSVLFFFIGLGLLVIIPRWQQFK